MQVARIEDDMTTGTYAKDTRVSVERTRNAIERTLARYGASGFGYMRHEDRHMLIFEAHHRRDLTQRWRIPRGVVRDDPVLATCFIHACFTTDGATHAVIDA